MCSNFYSYSRKIVFIRFISLIRLNSFIFFQHSLLGCSQYCGLKVLFTNLIRKLKNNDIFEGSDSQGVLIIVLSRLSVF